MPVPRNETPLKQSNNQMIPPVLNLDQNLINNNNNENNNDEENVQQNEQQGLKTPAKEQQNEYDSATLPSAPIQQQPPGKKTTKSNILFQ